MVISVGLLSGCNEIANELNQQTVEISGTDVIQTVHRTDSPIILDVSGITNDITVSKDTDIIKIEISGTNNIVRVSREHSYTSDISGIDNLILYYD